MYNPNHHNTHHNFSRKRIQFTPPDWEKMSLRQKMEYIKNEIDFVLGKIRLPDSDTNYWRHQLSYFLWLPLKNALCPDDFKKRATADEYKKAQDEARYVGGSLKGRCERAIPLDREAAIATLQRMSNEVGKEIESYDLRALNNLRAGIGMEPEANLRDFTLFESIFATERREVRERSIRIA